MTMFELENLPRSRDLLRTYILATIREIMTLEADEIQLVIPKDSPYLSIELFFPFREIIMEEIKSGSITSPSLYIRRINDTIFLIKVR